MRSCWWNNNKLELILKEVQLCSQTSILCQSFANILNCFRLIAVEKKRKQFKKTREFIGMACYVLEITIW